MMASKDVLPINLIRMDFQSAECLVEETVYEYTQRFRQGESIEPVVVRFDGDHYWLQDGFHRVAAAKNLGLKEIEAEILPGTYADMEDEFKRYIDELKRSLAEEARQRVIPTPHSKQEP